MGDLAITFPHLFAGYERRCADRTIKDSWPDAWEAIFGIVLQPGESREKDRRAFEMEHADDWIVVSAITSDQQPGFVEVVATPGAEDVARELRSDVSSSVRRIPDWPLRLRRR